MIRAAVQADAAAIEGFLARHSDTSMFLRSNLRRFGIGGSEHPYAMTYLLDVEAARVRGVVGVSNSGMLAVQIPDVPRTLTAAVPIFLNGRKIAGISGETEQVRTAREVLGIGDVACDLDEAEQLYALDLASLSLGGLADGRIRLVSDPDLDLIAIWRVAYHREVLGAAAAKANMAGRADAEAMIGSGQYRMLEQRGKPVAMTGFNATMPDCVQIGAVYVPPELRSRGLARAAVALHLAEARSEGVTRAVLFASGAAACRAYAAIGFERAGSYSLVLFREQMELPT